MTPDQVIKDVLTQFGETWNEKTVWRVQGTAVISHKALERIAAKAKIAFDLPQVLRCERDEAVILVNGRRGDEQTWSIGEACINQNYRVSGKQAAYPWAMAEKRAKDRVILKLIQLRGLAYSEEEADEFRGRQDDGERAMPDRAPPARQSDSIQLRDRSTGKPLAQNESQRMSGEMMASLWKISGEKVDRWLKTDGVRRDLESLDQIDRERVETLAEERRAVQ